MVPQYISIDTSIYIYGLLVDPKNTSQPNKLLLELWFNFPFEILNEWLGIDVGCVNLVLAALGATLVSVKLWICERFTRNGKLG